MASHGVERWLESLADSPARICPLPEQGPDLKERKADSGGTTPESSKKSSRSGSSSKTYPAYLAQTGADTHAYAAGLIDGEGCFGVRNHYKHYYNTVLEIGMSTKAIRILNLMHATYGGSVSISRNATEKWSAAATWNLNGSVLLSALKLWRPFLRLKETQADIIISLLEEDARGPKAHNGQPAWTPERTSRYQASAIKMTELNRKGPDHSTESFARFVGSKLMKREVNLFGEQWEMFSGQLPRSGSMRNGALYERPMLAPRIAGIEPLYWPTAKQQDGVHPGAMKLKSGQQEHLTHMANNWPTPRSEDSESCGNHPGAVDSLTGATRQWATPNCRDDHNPSTPESPRTQRKLEQGWTIDLNEQAAWWTTPQAHDASGGNPERVGRFGTKHGGANLADDVTLWKTPDVPNEGRTMSAKDVAANGATDKGKRQVGLENQVTFQTWPTPNAQDGKQRQTPESAARRVSHHQIGLQEAIHCLYSHPAPDHPQPGSESSPSGPTLRRRLNPAFVDWLMSLPPGWTDYAPVETASWYSRQRSHLRSLLGEQG
jgi:hypothetical protein